MAKIKIDPITALIDEEPNNRWVKIGSLVVYIRTNGRWILGERKRLFEIATVDVSSRRKGKGLFTAFLEDIELRRPFDGVYIENVLTPRFADFAVFRPYPNV